MSTHLNQSPVSLPPEFSLLLACARTEIDDEMAQRVREMVRQPIDWKYLIEVSLNHGLMPLLYENLKKICPELVPAEHLVRLKEYFQKNSARSVFLTGELCQILDLFEAEGIASMPYKGPAIAVSIYGNLTLRQFADLDILVRKRDVWRCQQLLISMGYQPHFNITPRQLPAFLKLGYVQSFSRDRGMSIVELHWNIASRFFMFPFDGDRFWSRLVQMDLAGRKVLALAPEDLLLILCVHGAKDLWERLEWICGIAELIRAHGDINWNAVRQHAKELGAERILFLGLFLARQFFEADLPDHVVKMIEQPVVTSLAREVSENLLRGNSAAPGLRKRVLFHVRAKERFSDRLRYCARLLFTSTPVDWQIFPLPASLSFLYAFLRPFRLAKKYAADHSKSLFCS